MCKLISLIILWLGLVLFKQLLHCVFFQALDVISQMIQKFAEPIIRVVYGFTCQSVTHEPYHKKSKRSYARDENSQWPFCLPATQVSLLFDLKTSPALLSMYKTMMETQSTKPCLTFLFSKYAVHVAQSILLRRVLRMDMDQSERNNLFSVFLTMVRLHCTYMYIL